MNNRITSFIGLDVHKDSTAIAVAELGREALCFVGTVGPDLAQLRKALAKIGRAQSLHAVYEAGPCGYGLARELTARGYACAVIAPAKIARRPASASRPIGVMR